MSDTVLARIKPYDPRRGQVCRQYTIFSMKFMEEKGWYEVERELAQSVLKPLKQPPSGNIPLELLPDLFDIAEKETAVEMEEREEREKQARSKAKTPHPSPKVPKGVLTSKDLPKLDEDDDPPPDKPSKRGRRKKSD